MIWKALRAPDVAKCQQKYRVDWDATDGRNGGAQRTVWEVMMETERFHGRAQGRSRSLGLGLGLDKGIRVGQYSCGLGRRTSASEEDSAGALCVIRAPEASAVRRMCIGAAPDHHGHLARVKVELLAFTCCVAGRVKRGYKNLPSAEVRVFVMTSQLLMVKNKVVAGMAKRVMKKL